MYPEESTERNALSTHPYNVCRQSKYHNPNPFYASGIPRPGRLSLYFCGELRIMTAWVSLAVPALSSPIIMGREK